jgi:hypothetical protein
LTIDREESTVPKILYVEKRFNKSTAALIDQANDIIAEYDAQGFSLTLRQLYYQFVARDLLANKLTEYKRLGSVINDARLAGLIDWYAIEDRTRYVRDLAHWSSPSEIVDACASQYRVERWSQDYQEHRPEVWIEKDALVGVIQGVCNELDVPYFSCRGYTSQSELWRAARRLRRYQRAGQTPVILHFGDHDPSGLDMTRDVTDRMHLFECPLEVRRLALNMDQVEEYSPPPNPAKATDARFQTYTALWGDECWELDALEPAMLASLVRGEIEKLRSASGWKKADKDIKTGRAAISKVAEQMQLDSEEDDG